MTARKAYNLMFLGLVVGYAAMNVLATMVSVVYMALNYFLKISLNTDVLMGVSQAMTLILPLIVWLFVRRIPRTTVEKQPMRFIELCGWFCVAVAVSELLYRMSNAISGGIYSLLGVDGNSVNELVGEMSFGMQLLLVVVIAPVVEELVFRKLLLDRARGYGEGVALIATSVAFGLLHGNLGQVPYAAAVGFMLGYVMLRTDNIWIPIALHALNNLISVLTSTASERGGIPAGLAEIFTGLIIAGGVVFLIIKHKRGIGGLRVVPQENAATLRDAVINPGAIIYIVLMLSAMLTSLLLPLLTQLLQDLINRLGDIDIGGLFVSLMI